MEAARLGLHDYQLGGLRPGLGLEPWLAAPPLSTLSHALPGFLSHPQTPYASYLPVSAASAAPGSMPPGLAGLPGLMTMSQVSQACVPCFPSPAPPPSSPPTQAPATSPSTAAPTSPATSEGRISPGELKITSNDDVMTHVFRE